MPASSNCSQRKTHSPQLSAAGGDHFTQRETASIQAVIVRTKSFRLTRTTSFFPSEDQRA